MKNFAVRIPDANSWLLAALFFLIPIQVAPAYVLSAIMLLLWVAEGRFDEKWRLLRAVPLLRRSPDDGRERMRRAVPVRFTTIRLFESHLKRPNTGMMYVLFTAALWRGTREEKI